MVELNRRETKCLMPPDYSDSGNAEVFVGVYNSDIVYSDALGWLYWNGKFWERDDQKPIALGMELASKMLKDAIEQRKIAIEYDAKLRLAQAEEDSVSDTEWAEAKNALKVTKEYLAHAKKTREARKIHAMVELAKSFLSVPAETFDANPSIINTPGGIVDLATGEMCPHDRNEYCTRMTATAPGAKGADTWCNFLETITGGDDKKRGFLQLAVGMALHGKVYEEGLLIAVGAGRNGKSTFFNAVSSVLGDYAGSIDVQILTTDRQNRGAALATLRGKRLVIAGELEEGKRLSVSTIKQITSTDRINIEEKYKSPASILPSHTLVLHTNHMPRVGSTDAGTWRRLKVIPFDATIPTKSGISNFGALLVENAAPAILAWAVQGAMNFAMDAHRLTIPDVVEEATDAYREREDWLNNFLTECCIREPGAKIGASELYTAYKEWAGRCGDYIRRMQDFNTAMEDAGFEKHTPKNKRTWYGLRLDYSAKSVSGYY